MKCIRTKKWPIMEKCSLMKEIEKWSSTVKINSRVASAIRQNTLNERSLASNKSEAYK